MDTESMEDMVAVEDPCIVVVVLAKTKAIVVENLFTLFERKAGN